MAASAQRTLLCTILPSALRQCPSRLSSDGLHELPGAGRLYGSLRMPSLACSPASGSFEGNMPPPVGPTVLKLRLRRGGLVVPLAGHEGVVAGAAERLAPEGPVAAGVAAAGPEVSAGVEHGPTGHADGPVPAALVEAVRERRSPADQPVHIRRSDLRIVEGANRAERLVVSQQEQNVRPFPTRRRKRIRRRSTRPQHP